MKKSEPRRLLTIVIPVLNEAQTLEHVISTVLTAKTPGMRKEVILIDDGSTDQTPQILQKAAQKHAAVRVLTHPRNLGKGSSIKTGFLQAKGDYVIIQDADLEYSPRDYEKLLDPLLLQRADAVFGSRFLGGSAHRVLYYWHFVFNHLVTTLSNMCTNLNLTDMECGYKVFTGELARALAPHLSSQRFGIEPELVALCAKIPKIKIYEVGVSYAGRTYEEGKHIRWYDGIEAIVEILRHNFFRTAPIKQRPE